MESATVVFSWAASAIGILGFISVVIQQILFYKRDSKTMDRIEGSISSGHDKLEQHQCGMESRMESGHGGLESRMEREHRRLESRMESDQGKILTAITDVDKRLIQEFTEQKAKRTYLDGKESIISESISNLMSFSGIMEDLKKENVDLKEQNRTLEAKILSLEKELRQSQKQKQERSRQTHRDMGEELEL